MFVKLFFVKLLSFYVVLVIVVGVKVTIKDLQCLNQQNNSVCINWKCNLAHKKSITIGCDLVEPVKEINVHVKAAYTNPKIKPMISEFYGNICDILNGNIDSPIMSMGMSVAKSHLPKMIHSCPFQNRVEVVDFDINEMMSIMPPITPAGTYSTETIVFNHKNETIVHVKVVAVVKN